MGMWIRRHSKLFNLKGDSQTTNLLHAIKFLYPSQNIIYILIQSPKVWIPPKIYVLIQSPKVGVMIHSPKYKSWSTPKIRSHRPDIAQLWTGVQGIEWGQVEIGSLGVFWVSPARMTILIHCRLFLEFNILKCGKIRPFHFLSTLLEQNILQNWFFIGVHWNLTGKYQQDVNLKIKDIFLFEFFLVVNRLPSAHQFGFYKHYYNWLIKQTEGLVKVKSIFL